MPIRVLIVDDSAVMRELLADVIQRQGDMEVVGFAADPIIAREKSKELNPDVITLNVEMRRMDGITFLEKLMRLRPTPVVMISALTEANATATLHALELGAIDYVTKPAAHFQPDISEFSREIGDKIRFAANLKNRVARGDTVSSKKPVPISFARPSASMGQCLICIGASTGGIDAIKQILVQMHAESPPIVIVQHLPDLFTRAFAQRMNNLCTISVKEAEHKEKLQIGHAYVTPGHSHATVNRSGAGYTIQLNQDPPFNRHRPSVDVLFNSVAKFADASTVGILLTGMGHDGAAGLLEMKRANAFTLAQDEESCVVFGMPRSAIEKGAAVKVLPLLSMPTEIFAYLRSHG